MRASIVESETDEERDERRAHAGRSSGESYAATLKQLWLGITTELVAPAGADAERYGVDDLGDFDAVFITGSPRHVYEETPEVERQLDLMRLVFASGVPSFGSCAGLQIAVAAAGGTVRPMAKRLEAAVARGIVATEAGRHHPMLAGRPATWDAAAIHSDEVAALPPGATLLAGNAATAVQAIELRHDAGVFWGVQYHPELAPGEIAVALRRQASSIMEAGLANGEEAVERCAMLLDRLHDDPDDAAARWELGVDDEYAREERRRTELVNFLRCCKRLRRPPRRSIAA